MVVEEIDIPIIKNSRGEDLVEIKRDGLLRYVRLRHIPGGPENIEAFYRYAMTKPFHVIADDLLTSEKDGGLSSIDHPESFDLESGASYADEHAGYRSLRFDYFQLERIDPTKPRRGRIAIHYCPPSNEDEHSSSPELAIQFDIDYPSVALFLSRRHPEKWLTAFYDELEEAGDSLFASIAFQRFIRDESWQIGLPRRIDRGMSKSPGSAFLDAVVKDQLIYLLRDRFGLGASEMVLGWAHGIQENTTTVGEILSSFDLTELSEKMRRYLLEDDLGI